MGRSAQGKIGYPKDFDPVAFVGRRLEGVLFTANTIDFNFDEGAWIQSLGGLIHQQSPAASPTLLEFPIESSCLMQLLEQAVESAALEADSSLTLRFGNGQLVRFVKDGSPYENSCIGLDGNQFSIC